jgi:vitamin B12 transporter
MKERINRTISALALLLALALLCAGQTAPAVSGRVLDPQGAAVPGAMVTLYARDNRVRLTATTDRNGAYRFGRVSPGEYVIEVKSPGFARRVQELRIAPDDAATHDLQLDVAQVAADVVVTATGTTQSVDEVSKAITVISESEIDLRDEYSIAESLRAAPGLRVQQLGGPGSLTTIKTRGLRNEDTAVLIDGMRFRDSASITGDASAFLGDLLFVNTDRLEVLRGSGSSLYGTNAIGGVVNIITDEGGGRARGALQLEGGGLGFFRGRAKVAGGTFDDRLRFSAGLAHLNVSRGVDGNDAARNTGGQVFLQYNFTPSVQLTGRLFMGDSFAQLNDSAFAVPSGAGFTLPPAGTPVRAVPLALTEQRRLEAAGLPFSVAPPFARGDATFIPSLNDPDSRRSSRFFHGAITFTQQVSERASYRISYQRVATSRTQRDGPAGLRFEPTFNNQSDFDGRIDVINARTDFALGRYNFITGGYEFERESFANLSEDENPNHATLTNNFIGIRQGAHTFFAQDQLHFLDNRLQIAAAFRVQTFHLSQPEFRGGAPRYTGVRFEAPPTALTGDGSLSYFFRSTETKLRAHVGNGYRAPSLYERFGSFYSAFSGGFVPLGDPRLRPDRSIAFDAGMDQVFGGGRVRASITYFYTRLQEVIFFDNLNAVADPFGRSSGYRNTGGALARGLELSVATAATRTTTITASYTYSNADQRNPQVPGYLRTLGISDHLFTLVANQRLGKRIDITFDLFAASDYAVSFSSRPFIFDGPVKADLGVSYTLPLKNEGRSLRFYGKVENLFDREYFENGFRAPRAFFIGGTTFRF